MGVGNKEKDKISIRDGGEKLDGSINKTRKRTILNIPYSLL